MNKNNTAIDIPLFPWYSLLIIGLSLTGFMAWVLVIRALIIAGKRRLAFLWLLINSVIGMSGYLFCSKAAVSWWRMEICIASWNIIWAAVAWFVQHKNIGPAHRRLYLSRWNTLITPLFAGIVLSFCIGMVFGFPEVIKQQKILTESTDILDHTSILWLLLGRGVSGLPFGLFAGIWWCAASAKFRLETIIATLCGCIFSILIWFCLSYITIFFLHGGHTPGREVQLGQCILPWTSGFHHFFLVSDYAITIIGIIALGLLFGSPVTIGNFWKRAGIPFIAFMCSLPFWKSDVTFLKLDQEQMAYDLSNPDNGKRDAAHRELAVFLKRFPDHSQWAQLASDHAHYLYDSGKQQEARHWLQMVVDRYKDSNQWWWYVQYALSALHASGEHQCSDTMKLSIPMIDYESYFDYGWMTLTTIMHYWEHGIVPESKTKLRLRKFSKSENGIVLKKLKSLIDLDDAARASGYRLEIIPSSTDNMKTLLNNGFPILYPLFTNVAITYGYDERRSTLFSYDFSRLSLRLRTKARKDSDIILSQTKEGTGECASRLKRIALECRTYQNMSQLSTPFGHYFEPFCAIMYPDSLKMRVAALLNKNISELNKNSDGYRAAFVALEYLDRGDPKGALEWAHHAENILSDSLPYYIGYLAFRFWERRNTSLMHHLPLEKHFSELAAWDEYFKSSTNQAFHDSCTSYFIAARSKGTLPRLITMRYFNLLSMSSPEDRQIALELGKKELSMYPAYYWRWYRMEQAAEWEADPNVRIPIYRGCISTWPYDYNLKLRLAVDCIRTNQFMGADSVLQTIPVDSVRHNADFYYCKAALAEWKGLIHEAIACYRQCITMRHYKPEYFQRYGTLLQKLGNNSEARTVLLWARRLQVETPDDSIKK